MPKKPKKKSSKPDPYSVLEDAIKIAKARIASCQEFEDLSYFYVMSYTNEELRDLGVPKKDRTWVGQYSAGSVDSDKGPVVLINIDAHLIINDLDSPVTLMADTLCHEMGHALWELLTNHSRKYWNEQVKEHRWGPEEAFADDFMFYVSKRFSDMNNEKLFKRVATQ